MTKGSVWMPFYTTDYLSDTMHLSTVQHGAYLLLLIHYWRSGPLPDDDGRLSAICKMPEREWRKNAPTIREFFRAESGLLHQKRADTELEKQMQISIKRSASAQQMHMQKHSKPDASAPANAVQVHPTVHNSQKRESKPLNGESYPRVRNTREAPQAAEMRQWFEKNLPAAAREFDPLKTGMADLKCVEGHPCIGGYFVDTLFEDCVRAAGMHLPASLNAWQPLIGWLAEGYVESEIMWLIRKLADRDDYRAPRSLAYFTKAIHDDCRTGLRDGYAPWHE